MAFPAWVRAARIIGRHLDAVLRGPLVVSLQKSVAFLDRCAATAATLLFGVVNRHLRGGLARSRPSARVVTSDEKRLRFDDAAASATALMFGYRWLRRTWNVGVVASNEAFEYLAPFAALQRFAATARATDRLGTSHPGLLNRSVGGREGASTSFRPLHSLSTFARSIPSGYSTTRSRFSTPDLLRGVEDWAGVVWHDFPCLAF